MSKQVQTKLEKALARLAKAAGDVERAKNDIEHIFKEWREGKREK